MIIYCTLYRVTEKGDLKVVDRTSANLQVTRKGLEVVPTFSSVRTGSHHLVLGISTQNGCPPKRLTDCGQVILGGWTLTIHQTVDLNL